MFDLRLINYLELIHHATNLFVIRSDGVEMDCDFQHIDSNSTVITRYSKIDYGRFISGAVGATFIYLGDSDNLLDLYTENRCYQSIDQLCQPWLQLQYAMYRSAAGSLGHRCQCLRYNRSITEQKNATSR